MAKINPVKVKQDADKLEKAGKVTEAIALYKQVIDDNPRDWNVINKVGDLYAKLNKFKDAARAAGMACVMLATSHPAHALRARGAAMVYEEIGEFALTVDLAAVFTGMAQTLRRIHRRLAYPSLTDRLV